MKACVYTCENTEENNHPRFVKQSHPLHYTVTTVHGSLLPVDIPVASLEAFRFDLALVHHRPTPRTRVFRTRVIRVVVHRLKPGVTVRVINDGRLITAFELMHVTVCVITRSRVEVFSHIPAC